MLHRPIFRTALTLVLSALIATSCSSSKTAETATDTMKPEAGSLMWVTQLDEHSAPSLISENIVWVNSRGDLHGLDLENGQTIHMFEDQIIERFMGSIGGYGAPAAADDLVIVASKNRILQAIEQDTGEIRWEKPVMVFHEPVLVENGIAMLTPVWWRWVGSSRTVRAIHVKTGEEAWRFEVESPVSVPGAVLDGVYYLFSRPTEFPGGTEGGQKKRGILSAMNVNNGEELWKVMTEAPGEVGPIPTQKYVVTQTHNIDRRALIAVLDRATGVELRSRQMIKGEGRIFAATDELIYLSNGLGQVVALDVESLEALWTYTPDRPDQMNRAVMYDNTLYVTTRGSSMYALDAKTGRKIWAASSQASTSGPLVANESLVVFGDVEGNTYAVAR